MARKGIQLAYPFEESRLLKWNPPFIVQPKLDGDRARAIIDDYGVVTLLSSEENEITSVPHIVREIENLGLRNVELDGELYRHGMNHQQIHGIASRTVNIHNEFEDLQFHIFDVVNYLQQVDRLQILNDIFSLYNGEVLQEVMSVPVNNLDEVMYVYNRLISNGFEGIIVRDSEAEYVRKRSTRVMKFKPKKSDFYMIIGSVEEVSIHGEPKGTLGALICTSGDGETFNVGTGFTFAQRANLWQARDRLVGKVAHVAYQHITSGRQVPRFPVFVEIIWDLTTT